MAKKSRIAIVAEYGALRAFCAAVNAVPYAVAMALARALAWFAFRVLGLHRGRTMERLRGTLSGNGTLSLGEAVRVIAAYKKDNPNG